MGWCQSMTLILWLRELVMNSKSTSALLEHQPLKENKRRSDKANLMTKSPPKVQGKGQCQYLVNRDVCGVGDYGCAFD